MPSSSMQLEQETDRKVLVTTENPDAGAHFYSLKDTDLPTHIPQKQTDSGFACDKFLNYHPGEPGTSDEDHMDLELNVILLPQFLKYTIL